MANDLLINWEKKALEHEKLYKNFLKKVDKNKALKQLPEFHDEAFEKVDCLKCANCCKTTGPLFTQRDMDRIAKHLGIKTGEFIQRYLYMDEDGDFVLKQLPCPFLGADNYCSIYEVRPQACREYPHTDRKNIMGILGLTSKNALICPAVTQILEKIEQIYP